MIEARRAARRFFRGSFLLPQKPLLKKALAMFSIRFFAVLALVFAFFDAQAQLEKANDFYKQKRYADAIPLFEAALAEKNSLPTRSKLANCYRLTNQMDSAAAQYSRIVEAPKAKVETRLFYAESLMALGQYPAAKAQFLKHFEAEPLDSTGWRMARSCDLVPTIQPLFRSISVEKLPFCSEADDNSAVFFENRIVFTSDRADGGASFLKQKSGWTGRDFLKLWSVKFDSAGQFSAARPFGSRLNQLNKNTANASFAADGERVFFTRNADFTGRDETLNLQLFEAERAGGRWRAGDVLPFCAQEVNYMHPTVAPDGSRLVFASSRGGGAGGLDLFQSRKTAKGWSRPEPLGPEINTAQHEAFPFLTADGRLFFASKGHVGFGGFDIFVSNFDTILQRFSMPKNVGQPINGPRDDLGFSMAPGDSIGLFTSSRAGDGDDLFLFWIGEKKRWPLPQKLDFEIAEDEQNSTQLIENEQVEKLNIDSLVVFFNEKRLAAGQVFWFEKIAYDSAQALEPRWQEAENELEKLRLLLTSSPLLHIEIEGHVESFSKEKVLKKLTDSRVFVLKKWFAEKGGLPDGQVSASGLGGRFPLISTPATADEALRNRRTAVKILAVE